MRRLPILVTVSLLTLGGANLAWADGTLMPGTRALGAGGASRGAASGDSGPMLNPSGISLIRSYVIEGAYQYGSADSAQAAHVSFVDSTSAFNLGGALTYTFLHSKPSRQASQTVHLVGASLSFPLGDVVYLGGSAKYLHWAFDNASVENRSKGFVFDVGLTVRPMPLFSVGLVGTNLSDRENSFLPLGFGGGISVNPFPGLSLLLDGVYERVYGDPSRSKTTWIMGGAEYSAQVFAFRVGGGRDGVSRNGYLTGGASLVSQIGAIEIALRQDISGDRKSTFVGLSGRLFVPSP